MNISPALSDPTPAVYVVDSDISMRELLAKLVHEAGWRFFGFASAREFLSHSWALCPACLVLDFILPDINGLDLQRQIAESRADIPIIFLTGHADVAVAVRAMKAGATEFLTKPLKEEVLLEAIRTALNHSCAAQSAALETKKLRERYASLSSRERQVMNLVVLGLMNKQVGNELGISPITVKAHRGRMMQKMGARSLADLVNIAARLCIPPRGLDQPTPIPVPRNPLIQDMRVKNCAPIHQMVGGA